MLSGGSNWLSFSQLSPTGRKAPLIRLNLATPRLETSLAQEEDHWRAKPSMSAMPSKSLSVLSVFELGTSEMWRLLTDGQLLRFDCTMANSVGVA
mmetsp:Transcript_55984/g.144112  ORF Transcript_55984/g.144112 Transcript_55984/m.144112 type:complete len:95 (+) Transcript_55984:331-615(+)